MAKRITKKAPIKQSAARPAPAMKRECGCGNDCMCGCHKHGSMHIVKHIIVWAIIFALGLACGKMMNCGHHRKMPPKMQPVFTNGCLDMASVKCPKMSEQLQKADVNGDNCISVEEYKAWKRANHPGKKGDNKDMRRGLRGLKK